MRARLAAVLLIPLVLVAACSLPTDESVIPIDRDVLGPAIANTTTTTTTTTTTVPTPTVTVATSVPATPDSAPTSTESPTKTTPVDLYYTIGFRDEVAKLTRELQEDPSLQQIVDQLESPSDEVRDFGLRTAVPRGMVLDITVERGTATISLDQVVIDRMTDANFGRAVSQLVLTVTSFRPADSGGIGLVRFFADDDGVAVFVPAGGGTGDPGQELAFEDFAPLIASATAATTTTTPTDTATTTTQSPTDPEVTGE